MMNHLTELTNNPPRCTFLPETLLCKTSVYELCQSMSASGPSLSLIILSLRSQSAAPSLGSDAWADSFPSLPCLQVSTMVVETQKLWVGSLTGSWK